MLNFQRNNLDNSTSPYLQQHKDNPIYWQEWNEETLDYAKNNHKIIFVSIGYAACHWCHVMAKDSFSNLEIAKFLNQYFVSIKVDREQRPDIDSYCLSFIQQISGQGGWPLNVFFSSKIKPIFALTYLPSTSPPGFPSFLNLIHQLKEMSNDKEQMKKLSIDYEIPLAIFQSIKEQDLFNSFKESFIPYTSSFSEGLQFPPHNTLLLLLHYYDLKKDKEILTIILSLLDVMAKRGLHDHLQGGFYRYCVDSNWTIPHFEKMLYDQALLLWVYSAAYKISQNAVYKTITEKIISCLDNSFFDSGLYCSSLDADTNHHEGLTYLWSSKELKQILTEKEFSSFKSLYEISEEGNFEGKLHFIKQDLSFLPEIENKLLSLRKKREQPSIDKKKITSWNSLLGIAFLIAYRYLNNTSAKAKSELLFKNLWNKHYLEGKVRRSSLDNKIQEGEFLEDHAALLLFATYLSEEDEIYLLKTRELYSTIFKFNKSGWKESLNLDFKLVPASIFDHPLPSSTSLAELAVLRSKIVLGEEYKPQNYRSPLNYDFFNLMVLLSSGNFHLIHTPYHLAWKNLPLNSLQIKNKIIQDCFAKNCQIFSDTTQLLNKITKEQITK
ncbi:thioredoxin domain-containing protein [Candidatus Woesearchaeota archaeon]|nr:thioredoxin domain-containing protein [Candidatus Woesearchaeota archaeon]